MKIHNGSDDGLFVYEETSKEWQFFKERYLATPEYVIDPGIRNVVKYLGNQEGIIPVWSCEGHLEEELSRTHVIVAVSSNGKNTLEKFYTGMVEYSLTCGDLDPYSYLQLDLKKFHLICGPDEDTLYPFHSIAGCYLDKPEFIGKTLFNNWVNYLQS